MTKIYTQNKTLVTSPIRTLIRNGESNADEITIVTSRFYGDYDLSQFGFVIEAVNSENTCAIRSLEVSESGDELHLKWLVTPDFTAVSGPLKITLKALSTDGSVEIRFDGGEIQVCGEDNSDLLPAEIGEQILSQLEARLSTIEPQISQTVSEKVDEIMGDFDPTSIIENNLPQNLVTSDDVRSLEVISAEDYESLDAPSADSLYIII